MTRRWEIWEKRDGLVPAKVKKGKNISGITGEYPWGGRNKLRKKKIEYLD